jgi:hypothetical protein
MTMAYSGKWVAFDINQSPFPLYRLLPPDFSGALWQREFRAVETPFLVPVHCLASWADSVLIS